MTAPAGANVGLYVDLVARVSVGDVIETQSGRRYLVAHVRVQTRGKHAGRQHLRAVVMAPGDPLPSRKVTGSEERETVPARVHRIRWYPRG